MEHDGNQSKTPGVTESRRHSGSKRNKYQQEEGNPSVRGKFRPIVMSVVGVNGKVLNGMLLVNLWKCSQPVPRQRPVL